jgi:hypothetical protein
MSIDPTLLECKNLTAENVSAAAMTKLKRKLNRMTLRNLFTFFPSL